MNSKYIIGGSSGTVPKSSMTSSGGSSVYNNTRRLTVATARGVPHNSSIALAEELEKTEQSITLALQEIDKNFGQANRIISESILPSIDKYSQESRRLWNNVGFWKDFLESSAQVTLSTYEEIAAPLGNISINEESIDYDITNQSLRDGGEEDAFIDGDITPENQSTPMKTKVTPGRSRIKRSPSRIPILTDPDKSPLRSPLRLNGQTILPPPKNGKRRQVGFNHQHKNLDDSTFDLENPSIPDSPDISVGLPPSQSLLKTPKSNRTKMPFPTGPTNSVLRHQVLNRNWRIQATPKPLSINSPPMNNGTTNTTSTQAPRSKFLQQLLDDDSSMSDVVVPPKLQSDLFSPINNPKSPSGLTPKSISKTNFMSNDNDPPTTKTHITTSNASATKLHTTSNTTSNTFSSNLHSHNIPPSTPANRKTASSQFYDDSDSDIDHIMDGMSPPVTRQFAVAPTSDQLMKTPARKVAQTIVNDILRTVGGADDSESMLSQESFFNDHSFTTAINIDDGGGGDVSDSDSDGMDFSL